MTDDLLGGRKWRIQGAMIEGTESGP